MRIKAQVRRSDIQFETLAGKRVLPPVVTTADPGELIAIEWYPHEWVAIRGLSVWRGPRGDTITHITPMTAIGALFVLERYDVAARRTEVGLLVPECTFEAVTAGPGCRFAVEIRAQADLPPDTHIMVTVPIELPPPCFSPRAAA